MKTDHDHDHHPYEQSYRPPPLPRRSVMLPALVAGGLVVSLGLALLSRVPRGSDETAAAVQQPSGVEPGEERVAGAPPSLTPSTVGVSISPDIVVGCHLPRQGAYVQFDEASRQPGDMRRLDNVARCLGGGPLEGRSVRIVGQAGDRAESDAPGPRSAHAVANYLVESGITPSRLIEVSRGKSLGEPGDNGQALPVERRVVIELAP